MEDREIEDLDLDDPLVLARECVRILDEKKINELVILEVGASTPIATHFVVGTGLNARHLKSGVDAIEQLLKQRGLPRRGIEGYHSGNWVLLDLGDVVVHLFLAASRKFYDLEFLWGDCPRVALGLGDRRHAAT